MTITHDIGQLGSSGVNVKYANSAAPNDSTSTDLTLISTASVTKCGFIRFTIPQKDTLTISNKAFLHKIRLRLDVSNAGSELRGFPLSSTFTSTIDYSELTYSTPNREGDQSNIKWNPANPSHIVASSSTPICVGGNKFSADTDTSSTGIVNFDITESEIAANGYDFGSVVDIVLYNADGSTTIIDISDSSVQFFTKEKKPDQATLSSTVTTDGLSANLSVTLPNDDSIDKYYLDSAGSAGISASGSEDFGQATPNIGATEVVPMSSVATLTQGANKFVRVFTENDDFTDSTATAGNEIVLFRPAINEAVLHTDSALSSALGSGKENATIGQKLYLKVTNSAVGTASTGNKFTKIRVNWDSGTSDTDEDYAVYEMQDLSPVLDNASNTVVSHIYHTAGAKVVKVQVEDENGFRSDKGNITGDQPDVKVGFPKAIISPSSTKITQAKYGDRTTAVTLSLQQSRTSGSDKIINHYGWGYAPTDVTNTICTANALDNDNTVFDNGSKQVKVGALSYLENDATVFKIFGLASFNSSGVGVADTDNTNFDHYAYTSATASPTFDRDARPNIGSAAVDAAGNGVFFKEIECVVCTTKGDNEDEEIFDCNRYILVTDETPNQNINTNLFYISNVHASLVNTLDTVNENPLSATDETITRAIDSTLNLISADIIKIDSEDMFIHHEGTGDNMLVARGYNGTTPTEHAQTTPIFEYRIANRYKWGGYAKVRSTNIDFTAAGQITLSGSSDDRNSSNDNSCWLANNFYVGDIIKVGSSASANGSFASPKFYKIASFTRDGTVYPTINIETNPAELTDHERTFISTTMVADTDETDVEVLRFDSTTKPSITAAVFNATNNDDTVTFYGAVFDNTTTRFGAFDKSSTSNTFNFNYHWSEANVEVRTVAPETLDLDTLASNSNIAIEKVAIARSGGITAQMPLGIRRYPVGVTRTKLGIPKVTVQAKALDQTGYRALFSLVEGNRYDYIFLDSKKLDSPTTSYRTLRMRLESGNLTKDTTDPNVYLANLNFVILGEDVT